MSKNQTGPAASPAARDRGLARMRTVAAGATAASIIAVAGVAASLPGKTPEAAAGSGSGVHRPAAASRSGGTSSGLSTPSSGPAAGSGAGRVTSGGS